ncbi:MAG: glycosyltransferase family 2 protein [Syntrophales bacterium]
MHNPKVNIIILHFRNFSILSECLQSSQKISYPAYEITVVNTGSRLPLNIATQNKITESSLQVINTQDNLGYARGNNIGIRDALKRGSEYILLLNDDTVVSPDFLSILLETAEKSTDIGIAGPTIYHFDEPQRLWFAGARFDPESCMIKSLETAHIDNEVSSDLIDSDYITGCALLIKKAVIEKIGLLDERFFLYWEDVDWGLRAKKAGLRNFVVPQSRIWHKVSVSTGGMDSPLRAYHKTRSHLLMAKLHSPKALTRLHMGFFRDIAWLLIKSSDINRVLRARAYMAGIIDYHRDRTDRGPQWLWSD